jgi:serine/threonine-protein kinase
MKNLTRGILVIVFALALGLAPALQAAGDRFAAIAYSPKTGRWGYGANYETKGEAIARARRECGRSDARTNWCRNAWIALAISDQSPGGWGSAWGETAQEARQAATRECLARNPDARVVLCVSAYE